MQRPWPRFASRCREVPLGRWLAGRAGRSLGTTAGAWPATPSTHRGRRDVGTRRARLIGEGDGSFGNRPHRGVAAATRTNSPSGPVSKVGTALGRLEEPGQMAWQFLAEWGGIHDLAGCVLEMDAKTAPTQTCCERSPFRECYGCVLTNAVVVDQAAMPWSLDLSCRT